MYEVYAVDEKGRARTFFVNESNYDLVYRQAEDMLLYGEEIEYMRRVL